MIKIDDFKIIKNEKIAKDVFLLELNMDTSLIARAGQFINIAIDGFYLRRPISICDYEKNKITIIYKIMGKATNAISHKKSGETLNIMYPLGNGFNVDKTTKNTILVGGGVGVPPLINLAKKMLEQNKNPQVIIGFNTRDEIFSINMFKEIGINPIVCTADGSYGERGLVTDIMKKIDFDYVCACGPEPMLRAIGKFEIDGQFSFEARMGCGFGGCMGCSCETKYGYKRICKDGPVLESEEIIW